MKDKKNLGVFIGLFVSGVIVGILIFNLFDKQTTELDNNKDIIKENNDDDVVIDDTSDNEIVDTTSTENDNVQNGDGSSNERYNMYISGLKNSLRNLKNADSFEEFKDSYLIILGGDYFTLSQNKISSRIKIEQNGDTYLNFEKNSKLAKKYGENYKVSTNIVNAGIVEHGQDASVFFWFINEKGEFLYIDINEYDIDKIEVNKINELKNVVDVTTMYNGEADILVAIDIDGKYIDVN